MNASALSEARGRPVLEIWTKAEVARLFYHLQNENGPVAYVMGFVDKASGLKTYKRAKSIPVLRAISWALASMEGRKVDEEALTFVPYSTNPRQESRWGGFDFDAHDGNIERARRFAFEACDRLRHYNHAVILESSGSGGWHLWAIDAAFKPVSHWKLLLRGIAQEVGAPIQSGICEIFPPDTLSRGFGKGMRAPGSWNPGTRTLSEIHWHNAESLVAQLPPLPSNGKRRIGELASLVSVGSSIEKELSLSFASFSLLGGLIGGAEAFRISQPSTRHDQLKGLVCASYHQLSRTVAEALARAQYAEKTVPTNASLAEHAAEFASLWEWRELQWIETLCEPERERRALLSTDAERGAFCIVRSYAQKAKADGVPDFPIARDNLAHRIGMTPEGAGKLRRRFVGTIIEQTAPYRPNVAPTRYRWIADISQPF